MSDAILWRTHPEPVDSLVIRDHDGRLLFRLRADGSAEICGPDAASEAARIFWREVTKLAGAPTVPVSRLQALIDTWEDSHTGWCCSRGCSVSDGKHLDEPVIDRLMAGNFEFDGPLPLIDCPSFCTCGVGPYVDALRAAMRGEEN